MTAREQILAKPKPVQEVIRRMLTVRALKDDDFEKHFDELATTVLNEYQAIVDQYFALGGNDEVQLAEDTIVRTNRQPGWAKLISSEMFAKVNSGISVVKLAEK